MENRHSSPARSSPPRPKNPRKRSNSLPIVEALGCSEAEANLIMAEGRAAIRRRQPSVRQAQPRRHRSVNHGVTTFRPQDHIQYLNLDSTATAEPDVNFETQQSHRVSHGRTLSNESDNSTSTITGPVQSSAQNSPTPGTSPGSPLDDYSANLAKFIKSQLNSIPSYNSTHPLAYPRSCPDLSLQAKTPPESPKSSRPSTDKPFILELPPTRPPLRSAFSEWSSTDDETDGDVPPLPEPSKDSKGSGYTPSILRYYQDAKSGSFLLSSTPQEESKLPKESSDGSLAPGSVSSESWSDSRLSLKLNDDYLSSSSTGPKLTVSSVPSMSSASTASYFDCNRPPSISSHLKDRIIAAVSPHHSNKKVLTAVSPFEGADITRVHDVFIESQNRLVVDGLSFDLVRDFKMPEEGARTVSTPC